MTQVDAIVCGAGVIGIAVARALALAGLEVLLLDREATFGTHTSARNSEVIHAGLYYPEGSLKARLCIAGRERLYAFCAARGVPHARPGKLVVAVDESEVAGLERIQAHARAAGVALAALDGAQARALEPALACVAALHSPHTGIVDSHALMLALLGEAEAQGAQFVGGAEIAAIGRRGADWTIRLVHDTAPVVAAPLLVNAAGLGAQQLAGRIEELDPRHVPPRRLARGHYFAYSGRVPFRHLIYPLPVPGGLGTHLTLDLGGQARFGPDVEWIEAIDYAIDPARAAGFARAAARFWPSLDAARLRPDFAGIRPKLAGPGDPDGDFVIQGAADHGLPGLVNLFGIESPGLTASLAIADAVRAALGIRQTSGAHDQCD